MKNVIGKIKKTIRIVNQHPLSADKKYKRSIYLRLIKWQLTKKKYSNGKIIHWINNSSLILFPGRTSAVGNYYFGLFEYEPMAFLSHYISKEDIFFDLGANVGVYSVLAKNAKQIVAFEPAKDTFDVLMKNIEVNQMNNVIPICKGVSEKDGKLVFTKNMDAVNRIVNEEECNSGIETEEIEVVSLDSYTKKNGIIPNVIKIDTEGAEESIIRGGRRNIEVA